MISKRELMIRLIEARIQKSGHGLKVISEDGVYVAYASAIADKIIAATPPGDTNEPY